MPTATAEAHTISKDQDEYVVLPPNIEATLDEIERRVERLSLDGDLDEIPAKELGKQIQGKLESFSKRDKLSPDEKRAFDQARQLVGEWVDRLDPELHDEDRDVYYSLPEADAIFHTYKREIVDSLTEVDHLLKDIDTKEAAAILTTLVFAKTAQGTVTTEMLERKLKGSAAEERLEEAVKMLTTMRSFGPIPFGSFVEKQFAVLDRQENGYPVPIDVRHEKSGDLIKERVTEIETKRLEAHQEVIRMIDATLKPRDKERFEKAHPPEQMTISERWLAADRSRKLSTVESNKYLEPTLLGFGPEKRHETEQYVKRRPAKSELEVIHQGAPAIREVATSVVEIELFSEKKTREVLGKTIGTAMEKNPWKKKQEYKASLETIEECVLELERWTEHKVVDAFGKEYDKDVDKSKLKPPIGYKILVPGEDALGNPIDETLDVSTKTMSAVTYAISAAILEYSSQGIQFDPEKAKALRERRTTLEEPADRVDQIRQKFYIQNTFKKVIADKKNEEENPNYVETGMLERAADVTTEIYDKFIQRYGRLSEYRQIAETRVRQRGIAENTPSFVTDVEQEINNVVVEMTNLERTLRTITMEVVHMSRFPQYHEKRDILLRNLPETIYARLATRLISLNEGAFDQTEVEQKVHSLVGPYLKSRKEAFDAQSYPIVLHETANVQDPEANLMEDIQDFIRKFREERNKPKQEDPEVARLKALGKKMGIGEEKPVTATPLLEPGYEEGQWRELQEGEKIESLLDTDAFKPKEDENEIAEGEFYELGGIGDTSDANWKKRAAQLEQEWEEHKAETGLPTKKKADESVSENINTAETTLEETGAKGLEIPVHHTEWIILNMLHSRDIASPDLLQQVNTELRENLSLGEATAEQLGALVKQVGDEQANTDEAIAKQLQKLAAFYNNGRKSNKPVSSRYTAEPDLNAAPEADIRKTREALQTVQEDEQFITTLEKLSAQWENDYKDEFPPEWASFVKTLHPSKEAEE